MVHRYTDEDNARIAQALKDGCSGAQIGKLIGVSRSAAIAQVNRVPWLKRIGFMTPPPAMAKTKMRRAKAIKAMEKLKMMPTEDLIPHPPEPEAPDGVLFVDIKINQCRWPLWGSEPGISIFGKRCCGKATAATVYCAKHAGIATGQPHRRAA